MNCSIYNHTGHRMQLISVSQMICECGTQLSESPSLGDATIFKTAIQSQTLVVGVRVLGFPQRQGPQEYLGPGILTAKTRDPGGPQVQGYQKRGMGTSALQKYRLAQYLSSIFILNSSLLAEARKLNTTFLRVPCRQGSKNQINSRDFTLK